MLARSRSRRTPHNRAAQAEKGSSTEVTAPNLEARQEEQAATDGDSILQQRR